ncbi:DUF6177 family protein [Amycolatopsis sp. EV170708-02-1]|uniref:DUF6177 family protein n=1 Tax=Amycolatopsis sp. EV170708-02-1 TaxID=2919322 RepID=UPI001F0C4005|nr:DUF6177 family protein [Amycolatopsis sp. EV170708-02-1]UMP00720.1 DUF6177 family protein [Amycolatopsis sp. EV170708-02-1]
MTGHPGAWARATPEAIVVEQFRDVVPASTWLIDAARTAVESGRALQLVTGARSGLTFPMESLLGDAGAGWVVRDENGGHRDGFLGLPLDWNGSRFVPEKGATIPPPRKYSPGSGDLEVRITTPFPAGEPLKLGRSTDTAMRALTGTGPTGWGVAEPVTEPWSVSGISAHCTRRAPASAIVVGEGVTGRLQVSQGDDVVVEEVRLSGPAAGSVDTRRIEDLAAECAGTVRRMIVGAAPGRTEGVRSAIPAPPALPYGVLFGHELVSAAGIAHAHRTPAARVRLLGAGDRKAVWCRFDGGASAPFEQLTDILHHYATPAGS